MSTRVVSLELEASFCQELEALAARLGMGGLEEALKAAAEQWAASQRTEIDERDPGQRYFVNEALDELMARKTKP